MDNFTLVGPKTKIKQHPPLLHTDMQISGILLSCIGPKKDLATQPINFGQLLKALITIDLQVLIFPFTCDVERIHQATTLLKSSQDYNAIMDIHLVNWGNPSKSKGNLMMLFYVGSTVISEDLAELKTSKPIQAFLSTSKFKAFPHRLHQMESKPLALANPLSTHGDKTCKNDSRNTLIAT